MTVSFVSKGTAPSLTGTGTGSTSVSPNIPSSGAAGDILILFVGTKPNTATIATPSGWTLAGTVTGGTGSQGADTGQVKCSAFWKVDATGSDAAPTVSITSGNASFAQIIRYRSTMGSGASWTVVASGGADTSAGTSWSATAAADPGIMPSDYPVITGIVVPTDALTWSAETVTATGATFGSFTETNEWSTTTGQQLGGVLYDGVCTAGKPTAPPVAVATASASTNATGVALIVSVRDNQMVDNHGFETNTANWSSASSYLVTGGGATLSRITTDQHSGTACADVVYTSSAASRGITYTGSSETIINNLAPNTKYLAEAWVRWKSGRPVSLKLADSVNGVTATSAATSTDAWVKLSCVLTTGATAPTAARQLAIVTDGTAASGRFCVDDVKLSLVVSGTLTGQLPSVGSSVTGTRDLGGPLVAGLPSLHASVAGTSLGGSFTGQLPSVSSSLAGGLIHGGFGNALGSVSAALSAAVEPFGSASLGLPAVATALAGETRPHGSNVLVVEDEKRAFRVYADDVVEIYRKAVIVDMTGPNGGFTATLPQATVLLLGPLGNIGTLGMTLPGVRSAVGCSLENGAEADVRLPRLRAALSGTSASANECSLAMTLPPLGGTDFEAYTSVTWVSSGGFVHDTGDLTVPLPTSYQINDVLLLAVTAEEADTVVAPDGWTQVNSSPQITGSAATGNQLAVFWRVSDGSEVPPVLSDAGDHQGAIIHAFHGCDIIDGPIDVDGGVLQESDDVTATMPTVSTTIPEGMVVYFGGHGVPTVDPEAALLQADAELANVTERSNDSTTDGAGGGLYVWTANCPPSTFVDSATFTLADPSARTGIVVALLPLTTNGGVLTTGGPVVATLPSVRSSFKEGASASLHAALPPVTSSLTGKIISGFVQFTLPRPTTEFEAELNSPFEGVLSCSLPSMSAALAGVSEELLKYTQTVGNDSATSFTVTHNFGTRDVLVGVYDTTSNEEPEVLVTHSTTSAVTISFASAPATNAYRVVVLTSV